MRNHSSARRAALTGGRIRARVTVGLAASAAAAALVPALAAAPAAAAAPGSAALGYEASFATAGLPSSVQVYERVDQRPIDYQSSPSAPVVQREESYFRRVHNTGEIDPGAAHFAWVGGTQLPEAFSAPTVNLGSTSEVTPLDPETLEPLGGEYIQGQGLEFHLKTVGPVGPLDGWGSVTRWTPAPGNPMGINSANPENFGEILVNTWGWLAGSL